jgi:hypothetical protein
VAFIHRLGASLHAHLHFHCVVIDCVFESATTGGIMFTAATGLDANAIADVQAGVRRRPEGNGGRQRAAMSPRCPVAAPGPRSGQGWTRARSKASA